MPRLGDWEFLLMRMLAVFLKPVTDTCDGKNTGQLHYPPDEYLHGKECIADNGAYERRYEHKLRDVGEEYVTLVDILIMAPDDTPLPQGAEKKHRWEYEVYKVIRYQDDAETDDDEAIDDEWRIDAECARYLIGIYPYQQGNENHAKQPGILHEKVGCHDDEVLVG